MRVLHIDCGRVMRGGQWQALRLVEGLAEAGHDARLLAPHDAPLFHKARERGLPAEPVSLAAVSRLSAGSDLVHAHDGRSHTLAAAVSQAPLVVSRRVAFAPGRGLLSRWKYSRAHHYIAVSRYVMGTLVAAGVPATKVSVVYDGVPACVSVGRGSLIVAPATEDPAKGSDLVREAAALAGVSVHFSESLEADLRRALLFVYISREEGLGSAVLLALAAGVPVIASRVGGLPEAVEDGENGLLVDNAPEAIASAITHLIGDEARRTGMAARARHSASERFSVGAMVRDTLKVYNRILSC